MLTKIIVTTLRIFVFSSFFFYCSFAQKIQEQLIDLSQLDTETIYNIPFNINDVIDDRKNKSLLISEVDYRKKHIVIRIKDPIENQLKKHFRRNYITDSISKLNVNIGIDYFYASPFGYSSGNVTFRISIYRKVDFETIKIKRGEKIFSIETIASNEDVRKPRDINQKVKVALHKALVLFNEFLNQDMTYFDQKKTELTQEMKLNKGIYYNPKLFLKNQPYFDADVIIIPKEKDKTGGNLYSIKLRDQRLQKEDISNLIWGYCDGENQYLSIRTYQHTNAFAKIEHRAGSYFIIHHNQNPIPPSQELAIGATAVLGILAGVLTGTYVVPSINNYKGKLVVDLDQKKIFPATYGYLYNATRNKNFRKKLKMLGKNNFDAYRNQIIDEFMQLKNK